MSFLGQTFLIFINFNLFFSLIDSVFVGVVSKNSLPNTKSPRFSPRSFPGSFIVLCFTFKSMVHHLEVILGSGIRSVSRFIYILMYLPTNVQLLFQYHLFKRLYVLQEGVENL